MSSSDQSAHPNLHDAFDGDLTELGTLDAIVRRLGDLDPSDALEVPPAGLFAAIEAVLDGTGQDAAVDSGAGAVELTRRRFRPARVVLVAAAVVVLVVAVSTILRDEDTGPITEQVALDGLPDFAGVTGSATVVTDGDARSVGVDLSPVDVPAGSHLELWLLDESVEDPVPLGPLADDTPHAIPTDVDLSATPIVDVSVELDDGNPAHSGISVARGRI